MATKKSKTTVEKPELQSVPGYKGFNSDFKCIDMQYEVGKTFEMPKNKRLACCPDNSSEGGLHFCESPLEVFGYYPPASSKYAEVKSEGDIIKSDSDTKIATSKLHICAEISLQGLIKAGVKFILDKVNWKDAKESNTGNQSAATNTGYQSAATNTGNQSAATNTGNRSAATNTGNRSAATNTGNRSAATNTGNRSAATNTGYQSAATNTGYQSAATNTGYQSAATNTGYQSAATNTGYQSAATNTGNRSAATNTGNQSAATNTGYQSAATNTGYQSAATNTGYQSAATVEGKESVAVSLGIEGKAKAKIGCFIVLAEWKEDKNSEWHRTDVQSFLVDGKTVKEDIFYSLKKGKLIEVE
jgi:hypothetical protein